MASLIGTTTEPNTAGVTGESSKFNGVLGQTTADGHAGVAGVSDEGKGNGVYGRSKNANGILGYSSSTNDNGVAGINLQGGTGVLGQSDGIGVRGISGKQAGVYGESKGSNGVLGYSSSTNDNGVAGINLHGGTGVLGDSDTGIGVWGKGGRLAGFFEGDVEVTGDIRLTNADCAEDFTIATDVSVDPGTVMVLGEEGALCPSQHAYDKRVAGVVSGAGDYRPGIILDKQPSESNRQPIALLGKVFCKADAQYGAIEIGDLLTTSPTVGHAMKADDPAKAFGAVIGKALRPLMEGEGLIPILIALQ